jgi:large subunit ribosomal protein L31
MTQHPETRLIDVVCATCGTTFMVRSTAKAMSIDVCSSCHPAYTGGSQPAVRDGSRTERFNRRRALAAT